MSTGNTSRRMRDDDLVVDAQKHPGWVTSEQTPRVGDEVYCTGGEGVVAAVLGKTSDGSRLLEIRLSAEGARPFFAAASNVLVAAA